MNNSAQPVVAYIASAYRALSDSKLESEEFAHGLIMFAVPDYGIQFRCRVEADPMRLELGALFALLRFLKTKLAHVKIPALEVRSSSPRLVFSLGSRVGPFAESTEWNLLLLEYTKEMEVTARYVAPRDNCCLLAPTELPSQPESEHPLLRPTIEDRTKFTMKPFQRGIDL
ncbi:MAG: hypothetical protein AB1644_02615 [Candidatus Zixiibacteriota bacterium]